MSGSMMFGCLFLDCCCSSNPRPKGVMLIVSQSGTVSVSFSLLCVFVIGILFEFGGMVSMTGSTLLGLSLLDLRLVVVFLPCGVIMGGAMPGVLLLVFLR